MRHQEEECDAEGEAGEALRGLVIGRETGGGQFYFSARTRVLWVVSKRSDSACQSWCV